MPVYNAQMRSPLSQKRTPIRKPVLKHRSVLMVLGVYNVEIHRAISRYAAEHAWHLNADMASVPVVPVGWSGDGVIAGLGHWTAPVRFVEAVRKKGIPVVDLYGGAYEEVLLPRVLGDYRAIGRLAAEHFLERGWRNFGWFSRGRHRMANLRYQGYAEVLKERGHVVKILGRSLHADFQHNRWQRANERLAAELIAATKPLAVFTQNDLGAAAVIEACETAGCRIPDEVAVLGVDDNELIVNSVRIPISSVQHDLPRVGYEGAALLDRLMQGKAAPRVPILIPPRGISVRASTDTFAVNHPALRRALQFMKENLHISLGVERIVEASGQSRRALEHVFQKELRQSIHEKLMHLRIRHVKDLLCYTDLSIEHIAAQSGFSHGPHLHRVFRKECNVSPRTYRVEHRSSTNASPAPSSKTNFPAIPR
jgi:LacI family transcriptional regulator